MKRPLRALLLEDNASDTELLVRALERSGFDVIWERVETREAMRTALQRAPWDIVISDYSMPNFNALEAIRLLREMALDLPFIIMSGTVGEEAAVEALKAGADDFLLKGQHMRIAPAVERALREGETRRERRAAEAALRESEARYRRILETTREGVLLFDALGRTTYANRRMSELIGYAPRDLIGRWVHELVDRDYAGIFTGALEQRRAEASRQLEVPMRRADGTMFWASLSTDPVFDDAGKFAGALAMVVDSTEQRSLREQLMVADRMASVGLLAAGIAHEINNPLAVIVANIEMCSESLTEWTMTPRTEELSDVLREAREAADRVRDIVRDVKVFSRGGEEQVVQLDVHAIIDSALRLAANEVRHRARLMKKYGSLPPVAGVESRLGQVFLNLLVNAAQAMPEGHATENEIVIATKTDELGRAVIEVSDNGAGIAPETLKHLFTPFFTTKPVGVGTGLGLSICRRIVQGLGGEICVESVVGRGSTFRVVLPSGDGKADAGVADDSQQSTDIVRRAKVLVVDDDARLVTVVRRFLELEHEVAVTMDPVQALEWIRDGDWFDLILCDVMMPAMTGMELAEKVRAIHAPQAREIIFMTGGVFTPAAEKALEALPNQKIDKPFDRGDLRTMIRRHLKRSGSSSGAA